MQKKLDDIFRMKENEVRELVENSLSITEIEAVVESLKSYEKIIDEKLELDEIRYKENDIEEQITELKRQLDFSRRTLASDQELTNLSTKIEELKTNLNDLNNEKLAIMEKYTNIRNNIISICLETIKNSKDIKLELSRQELLDRYTVDLQVLTKKKKGLEITYFNLSKTNNYRDNKLKVRNLKNKIKQIEKEVGQGILEMSIDITNEVVRYRNMIHELSLTDDNTAKYIMKVNKELAYTNTKISEIKSIIEHLENMSLEDYRSKLLNELSPSLIEQNYLSQSQVYESLLYPVKLQDNRYSNELLDEFKNILESIKCPVINITNDNNIIDLDNSLNLIDVDTNISYIENLIKVLEKALDTYKKGFLTNYIKSNVSNANLFSVPFERSKWEEYFNVTLEEKDINFLNLINSKYLSIKQRFTLSKNNCDLINKYEEIITNLLEELYYKLLSNYILDSNQYNVTLVDYNNQDSYELYISSTKTYLEERIESLKSLLKELKEQEEIKFQEINDEYERLFNIKEELKNSFENKKEDLEDSSNNDTNNINLDSKPLEDNNIDKEEPVISNTDYDTALKITDDDALNQTKEDSKPVIPVDLEDGRIFKQDDEDGSNDDVAIKLEDSSDVKEENANEDVPKEEKDDNEIAISPFNLEPPKEDDSNTTEKEKTPKPEIKVDEDKPVEEKKEHHTTDIEDSLIKDNPIIRDFFKPVFNDNPDNKN